MIIQYFQDRARDIQFSIALDPRIRLDEDKIYHMCDDDYVESRLSEIGRGLIEKKTMEPAIVTCSFDDLLLMENFKDKMRYVLIHTMSEESIRRFRFHRYVGAEVISLELLLSWHVDQSPWWTRPGMLFASELATA